MNIRRARYMATIYECRSISAAAKKLYVSQPSLSQTIQLVEKEIGVKIFDRSTSPLSLTYAGEKYMESVRCLLEVETNLERQLQEIKNEESGRIRIGISTLRGATFLPKILPRFVQKYPAVDLEIVETGSSRMNELLLQDKVDLAFLISLPEKYQEINYLTLCHEKMVLYAGKNTALAKHILPYTQINITEAANETFVSLKPGHGVRTLQDRMFFENNMKPKIFLETDSAVLAKNLAISCDMVALYPETMMTKMLPEPEDEPELYYPIAGERYAREFYLCYSKSAYLPKYFRDFIDITRNASFKTAPLNNPQLAQRQILDRSETPMPPKSDHF